MVPAILKDKYIIRFCVNALNANDNDIIAAWNLIKINTDFVVHQDEKTLTRRKNSSLYFSKRVSLKLKPINSDESQRICRLFFLKNTLILMIFTGHQSFNKFTDISKEIFSVAIIQSVPKILHENYCSFYLFFFIIEKYN